ncbi:VOC family protein [Actinomadura sp. DC4]|uniref:VOC family protein n=1 Tax=Actinomadura sp. DC4 TaxID=3055069 RepID=UPI0025B00A85|nr:VOC family protein [Actinomadura sp. DC4]MDN3357404.1 VOC family protein [Actinomadura sp. DC4]
MSETAIWPSVRYTDAHAAIRFLVDAFGFERVAVHETGSQVDHAELRWPGGGGVMLGSASREDSTIAGLPPGTGSVYVVTDDVDGLFERACAAGATVVDGPRSQSYGSGFTVRDPEGVFWSFGTYRGAGS